MLIFKDASEDLLGIVFSALLEQSPLCPQQYADKGSTSSRDVLQQSWDVAVVLQLIQDAGEELCEGTGPDD